MKSYWGVEHGEEIAKKRDYEKNDRSPNFKATIYNRDMVGKDPRAKANRKLHGKVVGREMLKQGAVGTGIGGTAGAAGMAIASRGKAGSTLVGGGLGALGGWTAGATRGGHVGRKKMQEHPGYTRRGNKW